MSTRDYIENKDDLMSFIGRRCFLSLACNSIKLHVDEDKTQGLYIWIDPPWQFGQENDEIESSLSCPMHTEEDYKSKFKNWCDQFNPIKESKIENIDIKPDGEMWIHFQNNYSLFVPKEFIPEDDLWYNHWYVNSEKAEQNVQTLARDKYMKKYYPALIAFLISFSAYAESMKFEYSSFYNKLNGTSIRSSFLEFCPKEISNITSSCGSSSFNFGKGFHFVHEADIETEKQLLLAYGDGIALSLRKGGFFVGAVNNPRYDKDSKPLSYTIFGNNKTNICDIVIYSHRLSDDTVKIEVVFREYAMKE